MNILIAPRRLALTPGQRRFASVEIPVDALLSRLDLSIERALSSNSVDWDANCILSIRLILTVDGIEYVAAGSSTGGVRASKATAIEVPTYRFGWTPTYGYFGDRSGLPRRLGEGKSSITARIEIDALQGRCDTQLVLAGEIAQAPLIPFRSSVAFDAATDAQEIGGDGVISLTHTAAGSDRAAFAGIGYDAGGPPSSSGTTYAGNAMTEAWDFAFATFYANAGYRLAGAGVSTGAQTVTNTLSDFDTNHSMGVITMTGVDSTTPVGTPATGSAAFATTISVTVGSVGADDLICDNLYCSFTNWVPGANQTERFEEILPDSTEHHGSTQSGADGGVMSWDGDSTNRISLGAIAFKPAAGGGGVLMPAFTIGDLSGVGSPGRLFKDPLQ